MPDDPNRPQEPQRDINGNPIPPPSFGSPPPARPLPGNPPPPSFGGPAPAPTRRAAVRAATRAEVRPGGQPDPFLRGRTPGPPPALWTAAGGAPAPGRRPAATYGQTPASPFARPGVYPVDVKGGQILTMGILSFVCFGIILGPVAYVQGTNALAAIDRGEADPCQRGKSSAGRICGLIGGHPELISIILNIGLAISGRSLSRRALRLSAEKLRRHLGARLKPAHA